MAYQLFLYDAFMVALLILGFGFIVFFHELGHFLAAKWMDVKIEQFALGFGPAVCSWRKGLGWVWGSSGELYKKALNKHVAANPRQTLELSRLVGEPTPRQLDIAARELGMSETEYRFNWVPLGGYVKMLGQDDLKPGAESSDPRAYNRKSIGARMVIVSAGVIMNVFLAAIGFMALFLIGFHTPAPVVGGVVPGSPAQMGGLQVGDKILTIDGDVQPDFTRIQLTAALLQQGKQVPVEVSRPGQSQPLTLMIQPQRATKNGEGLLTIGIVPPLTLEGPPLDTPKDWDKAPGENPQSLLLKPGDVITAVESKKVDVDEYTVLYKALQDSDGQPIHVTVTNKKSNESREVLVQPRMEHFFGEEPLSFAGLQPRVAVDGVQEDSKAIDKLLPGDVILRVSGSGECNNPDFQQFLDLVKQTGSEKKTVSLDVLRDGKTVEVDGLVPNVKLPQDAHAHGLGVLVGYDEMHAVTAAPIAGSPAYIARIPSGAQIVSIDGHPVSNWFQVRRMLLADGPDKTRPGDHVIKIAGDEKPYAISLADKDTQAIRDICCMSWLTLQQRMTVRITHNPLTAALWGVQETRDFILQFYVTLKRMFQGSVGMSNMMGPIGMVWAGSKLAFMGFGKLLWFLALISANLAVVNFLPIPVVDGGLFTFLIIEKVMGRPLSPKAQAIWQIVGLVLIIGVFVAVTSQDISRFLP